MGQVSDLKKKKGEGGKQKEGDVERERQERPKSFRIQWSENISSSGVSWTGREKERKGTDRYTQKKTPREHKFYFSIT